MSRHEPPQPLNGPLKGTELLVIDQAPLLENALDAYRAAQRALEELKAELTKHETTDAPAYERWYHSTFGATLTRIRETTAAILSQDRLLIVLRKRHWARFFADDCVNPHELGARSVFDEGEGTGSYRVFEGDEEMRAEQRARLRSAAEGADGEGFEFGGNVYSEDAGLYDDEWDYADEESGAAWFESLFNRDYRQGAGGGSGGGFGRREGDAGDRRGGAGPQGAGPGGGEGAVDDASLSRDESLMARLKERYRLLAKRLHPDVSLGKGTEQTSEHRELWIRAQRAYEAGNLDELDLLTALSGALTGDLAGSTSLYHLRGLAREVERLAEPLRARLEEVRCSRAWKWRFGDKQQRGLLQRNIEQELARELAGLRARLAEIATQIARFAPKGKPAGGDAGKESRDYWQVSSPSRSGLSSG